MFYYKMILFVIKIKLNWVIAIFSSANSKGKAAGSETASSVDWTECIIHYTTPPPA
jgi:hypothetical protein